MEHRQNVEKLLTLMDFPAQVDEAAEAVVDQYSAKLDRSTMTPALRDVVDAYQADLRKIIVPALDWNGLKTTYIYSYAKRLSPAQVSELITFYQTETGQHFVAIRGESAAEIAGITQHLVESDISKPLADLQVLLRQGLEKYRALTNPESKN
jgi:hypothetical protein